MRKKVLEKRMQRLTAKKNDLVARSQVSEDVNEVRSINAQLAELNEDIAEVQEELDILNEEEQRAAAPVVPAGATHVNGAVAGATVGTFAQQTNVPQVRANENPYGTMEYRTAFKRYVQTGTAIPAELTQRAITDPDGVGPANTSDLGAIIPVTIMNEFINEIKKVYGQLYSKVRKLNIRGGVKFPISDLSASFKWITETTVSPRQNAGEINQFIEFSYNIGEIRVSQTLLSSIVALDLFEREIVRIMVEAYMQAMDIGIVKGTGNGQMLGILNDTRITSLPGHIIDMTAADFNNWTAWRKKLFAVLPLGRRDGEFIFPLSTVESYLLTMADANNNPIFRQATGLEVSDADRSTSGRFFGREITMVEPDVLPDFDTANDGDIVGIFWQPWNYAINTNLQFGMKRYFDEEKNEWVNKALTIVDGKVVDPYGFYLIRKKAK